MMIWKNRKTDKLTERGDEIGRTQQQNPLLLPTHERPRLNALEAAVAQVRQLPPDRRPVSELGAVRLGRVGPYGKCK